jgi:hypothetical protein
MLREEQRLKVCENRVLKRKFGPQREDITGNWRKPYNVELHNLYSSPNIIRVIKSRIRWAEHAACMGEMRNLHKMLVIKPAENRPLGNTYQGNRI